MILSDQPSYNFFNLGTFLLFILLLLLGTYISVVFFSKKSKTLAKIKGVLHSRPLLNYSLFVVMVVLLVFGFALNVTDASRNFESNMRKELVSQLETVYGVEFSNETVNNLTKLSLDTVNSDVAATTVSAPFVDENNNKLYKYQVSSNGNAVLFSSDLEFTEEPTVIEEMVEIEPS